MDRLMYLITYYLFFIQYNAIIIIHGVYSFLILMQCVMLNFWASKSWVGGGGILPIE